MPYAVLVSLAQTIDEILSHDEDYISLNHKRRIKSIHENVICLQAFLDDFPEKVNTDLEGKIRDAANEAEDVVESFMCKQFEPSYRQWWRRHYELKRVAKKFNSVAGKAMNSKLGIKDIIKDTIRTVDCVNAAAAIATSSSSSPSPSRPPHKKEAMVGFEDDLLAIKERLCGESSKLQVIPIVGMGGIGKTTLATNAYHHPLITGHFDIRAWVIVSQDYSPQRIFSSLLDSMKEFETERCGQNEEVDVYQRLKNRRYLIVMDDMWSTEALDDIMRIFPDDDNGSRIMLTTRLSDVAAYADSCSSHVHEMHLMDADQSWALLHHKVFAHEELCTVELENSGKEIARSCGGLPLAITVIAGLLSMLRLQPN